MKNYHKPTLGWPAVIAILLGCLAFTLALHGQTAGTGTLQFNLMLSVDPLTLGNDGYREIFQAGETLDGRPLIEGTAWWPTMTIRASAAIPARKGANFVQVPTH